MTYHRFYCYHATIYNILKEVVYWISTGPTDQPVQNPVIVMTNAIVVKGNQQVIISRFINVNTGCSDLQYITVMYIT